MLGKTLIGCLLILCYVTVSINSKNVPITPNLKNLNKDFLSREGGGSAKPKQGTVVTPAVKPGAVTSLAASALKPAIVAAPPRDSKTAVATPTADPKAVTPPKDNKPVPVATPVAVKPAPIAAKPSPVAVNPTPVAVKPAPVPASPALTKPVAAPTPKPSNVKELINYYDKKSKDSYSEVARRGKTIVITAAVRSVNKEFLLREREFLLGVKIPALGASNNSNRTKDANTSPKSSSSITTPTAVETTPSTIKLKAPQPSPAETVILESPSAGKQTVAITKPAAAETVTVATRLDTVAVTTHISTPASAPKVTTQEQTKPFTRANASNVQELIMYFDGKQ